MKKIFVLLASLFILTISAAISFAQSSTDAHVSDLGWIDKNQMAQDAAKVNELTLSKIGTPIRRDLRDLDTLQKLLDQNLVAKEDYKTQQAMGITLGNILQEDFPETLEWKIYEDDIGRSRALCAKESTHCLFPITMLSRRIELGSKPDVKKIYIDAIALMEKHLPQLPYGGGIRYRLPRQ